MLPVNVRRPRNVSKPSAAILNIGKVIALAHVLGDPDEARGQAAEGVRERDTLRHLRHRDPRADGDADSASEGEAAEDPVVTDDVACGASVADDGDEHPELTEEEAAPRGLRTREAPQAQDEEDRRDDVAEAEDDGCRVTRLLPAPSRPRAPRDAGGTSAASGR